MTEPTVDEIMERDAKLAALEPADDPSAFWTDHRFRHFPALVAEIERLREREACGKTPLMRDVLAERDAANADAEALAEALRAEITDSVMGYPEIGKVRNRSRAALAAHDERVKGDD